VEEVLCDAVDAVLVVDRQVLLEKDALRRDLTHVVRRVADGVGLIPDTLRVFAPSTLSNTAINAAQTQGCPTRRSFHASISSALTSAHVGHMSWKVSSGTL